ncbi:hypothetical protein DH2020_001998 [Rehmannia glutinosa]|uniref:Reverse transcriptase zinc-binding domain-containing protein n=1 Tax=Rehmannia glutinosa TaxID=99300 RepID=A0ABR0XSI3_REHGL
MPIITSQSKNIWCWHPNKSGKFSVKSAYHEILSSGSFPFDFQLSLPSGSSLNPVWKRIWKLKVPPQFKFFAWRCSSEALSMVDFLAKHHITSSDLCPFCASTENANHAFVFCNFVEQVWRVSRIFEVVLHFKQSSFSSWYQDVILHSPPHIGNLFTIISCLIWYHMNKKKFKGIPSDPISIVMAAKTILRDFNFAECCPEVLSAPLSQPTHPPPLENFPRICFDGAISAQLKRCGVGVAVFDAKGLFVKGLSKKIMGIIDPKVAECLALREALKLVIDLNIGSFSVFGDAAQVILAANEQALGSSASSGIIQFCCSFISESCEMYGVGFFTAGPSLELLCQSLLGEFRAL